MAVFETWLKSDLKKPMRVVELSGNLFSADNGGNLIGVEVLDGGQAASLTGSVHGYVIRADGATVLVDGTLTGNRASIVLPASAYLVIGQASIVIKVGAVTVGACVAQVYRTTTDTLVDPANVIPSISDLLDMIDDCEQATEDANDAAELANTKAGLADDAATLANTKAGLADAAATAANTAAGTANAAAGKIDNMTVAANGLAPGSAPTVAISEVSGHKHILFGLVKGDPGKDFHIAKTFASIAAMMAYTGTDVEAFDFAMIDTGSVEDPDTGKLYCYEPDKTPKWQYIGDLSGAQGIKGETGTGISSIALNQDYTLTIYLDDNTSYTTASIRGATGETPDITIGTVTTLNFDQQAYVTLDPSSTPEDPVFNFGIPQGEPGSAENVYGNTVPMSSTDSTKVATAIGNKLDANQGSTNAGKFMRVGSTGAVSYDSPTELYSSLSDFPATGDEGKLYIAEDTGMMYVWDSEYVLVGGTSSDECEVSGDVVSFETFESKAKKLVVDIDPVQDLHGYDSPWPRGGGKNLLPLTVAGVKGFNTTGTWNGNEYTATSGVKFTVISNDGISVEEIIVNGTASSDTTFGLLNQANAVSIDGTKTYFVSGCPSGGGSSKYRICIYSRTDGSTSNRVTNDYGTGNTIYAESITFWGIITIYSGQTASNLSFHPMVEEGSSATDFAPYSNECPISGRTSADVTRTGEILSGSDLTVLDGYINTTGTYQTSSAGSKSVMAFVKAGSVRITKRASSTLRIGLFSSIPVNATASTSFVDVGSSTTEYTITVPNDCYLVAFVVNSSSSGDVSASEQIISSVKYYTSINTYTYTFPQSAGTVYGAKLTIHQDGTGTLIPDEVMFSDASSGWGYAASQHIFYKSTNIYEDCIPVCNMYKGVTSATANNSAYIKGNNTICVRYPTKDRIYIRDDRFDNENDFMSAISGIQIVLKIAEPQVYQLTNQQVISLLQGQNVVFADCGSIDLTYYRTESAYQVSLNTADIAELQGEVEELQNDFTGATASADGAHGLVPAPEEGDQGKFLKGDGTWGNVPNPQVMTGATSSTAGASGLVPAPAAGDQDKVLTGAGTWETPIGSRVYVVTLDAVSNTSGSYTHTTTVTGMTGDLKAVAIECSDPTIFHDAVTITTATDSVTLTCSDVAGSSTVKVSFLAVGNANPLSSTEYAALDARIGDLSDLTTTDKTSVVDAVNEVNDNLDKLQIRSDSTPTQITIPNPQANFTYTADEDCLLFVRGTSSSSAVLECGLGEINAVDNSVALYLVYNPTTTELQTTGLIPLKAGTKVSFVSSNWSNGKLNYIIKYT